MLIVDCHLCRPYRPKGKKMILNVTCVYMIQNSNAYDLFCIILENASMNQSSTSLPEENEAKKRVKIVGDFKFFNGKLKRTWKTIENSFESFDSSVANIPNLLSFKNPSSSSDQSKM